MTDLLTLMGLGPALMRKGPRKTGHAAAPGTGPEGETCGSCMYLVHKKMARTYLKCGLRCATWTGGAGTDVRARDAACSKWLGCEQAWAEEQKRRQASLEKSQ